MNPAGIHFSNARHADAEVGTGRLSPAEVNGWSKIMEHEVLRLADLAWCWNWLHLKTAERYGTLDNRYAIAILLVTAVATVPAFTTSTNCQTGNTQLTVIVVFNIVIGVLTGLKQMQNYAALSQQHRDSAIDFSNVWSGVRQEMFLQPESRQEAHDYIHWTSLLLDTYINAAPDVSDFAIDEFKARFGDDASIHTPTIISDSHRQAEIRPINWTPLARDVTPMPALASASAPMPATPPTSLVASACASQDDVTPPAAVVAAASSPSLLDLARRASPIRQINDARMRFELGRLMSGPAVA